MSLFFARMRVFFWHLLSAIHSFRNLGLAGKFGENGDLRKHVCQCQLVQHVLWFVCGYNYNLCTVRCVRVQNVSTYMTYRPIITFELTSLGRPLPCDVYKRLTNLEETVLFLEGMSPEYFSQNVSCRVNRLYFLRLKFPKFSINCGECKVDGLRYFVVFSSPDPE